VPLPPPEFLVNRPGSIKGQKVDERFTSSPTTFDEVSDPAKVEFPAKEPTPGQLAARLDREVPRLDGATRKARDDAGGARTLATVGIVVGVIGIGVGGIALGRRSTGTGRAADQPARAGRN